eukprot:8082367-Pyramimonas_sp.AAC.1
MMVMFEITDSESDAERLILESCFGSNSKIGNPMNFVDNSCRAMGYTESEDMTTEEGNHKALTDIGEF